MRLRAPFESIGNGANDFFHLEFIADMELRSKTHLDVAYAFSDVVFGQFAGDAFDTLGIPHNGTGIGEASQVFAKIGIAIFEDKLA